MIDIVCVQEDAYDFQTEVRRTDFKVFLPPPPYGQFSVGQPVLFNSIRPDGKSQKFEWAVWGQVRTTQISQEEAWAKWKGTDSWEGNLRTASVLPYCKSWRHPDLWNASGIPEHLQGVIVDPRVSKEICVCGYGRRSADTGMYHTCDGKRQGQGSVRVFVKYI